MNSHKMQVGKSTEGFMQRGEERTRHSLVQERFGTPQRSRGLQSFNVARAGERITVHTGRKFLVGLFLQTLLLISFFQGAFGAAQGQEWKDFELERKTLQKCDSIAGRLKFVFGRLKELVNKDKDILPRPQYRISSTIDGEEILEFRWPKSSKDFSPEQLQEACRDAANRARKQTQNQYYELQPYANQPSEEEPRNIKQIWGPETVNNEGNYTTFVTWNMELPALYGRDYHVAQFECENEIYYGILLNIPEHDALRKFINARLAKKRCNGIEQVGRKAKGEHGVSMHTVARASYKQTHDGTLTIHWTTAGTNSQKGRQKIVKAQTSTATSLTSTTQFRISDPGKSDDVVFIEAKKNSDIERLLYEACRKYRSM